MHYSSRVLMKRRKRLNLGKRPSLTRPHRLLMPLSKAICICTRLHMRVVAFHLPPGHCSARGLEDLSLLDRAGEGS